MWEGSEVSFWTIIAYLATAGTFLRFYRYFFPLHNTYADDASVDKFVSIIIPVRNESKNLRTLLPSLLRSSYSNFEIIVVDDDSDDGSYNIAKRFPIRVIQARPTPVGWTGKNWACFEGAVQAKGQYLLFTDADTIHAKDGLSLSMINMVNNKLDMLSAPPWHRATHWWEKLLGPFYILLNAGASYHDGIEREHPFAFGQYLLFRKQFYDFIGGHSSVCHQVSEDTAITRLVIQRGGRYKFLQEPVLYSVQMFDTFQQFIDGWIRLLRLGMKELKPGTAFLTLLPLLALNIKNLQLMSVSSLIPVFATLTSFLFIQKRLGNFSWGGVLLFPVSIIVFVVIASVSCISELFKVPLRWRGRVYVINASGSTFEKQS